MQRMVVSTSNLVEISTVRGGTFSRSLGLSTRAKVKIWRTLQIKKTADSIVKKTSRSKTSCMDESGYTT